MVDPRLIEYIKKQLEQGYVREEIEKALMAGEWTEEEIEQGFDLASTPEPKKKFPGPLAMLKRALTLYRSRFSVLLAVGALPFLMMSAAGLVVDVAGISLSATPVGSVFSLLLTLLLVVGGMAVQIWGGASLLCAVAYSEEEIGVIESYKKGWGKAVPYLWVSFLSFFIILGAGVLFFLPAIVIAVWFSMAGFVLIKEDLRGFEALFKSKMYVSGKWWGVFWRQIAGGLLIVLSGFFLSLVLGLPLSLLLGETGETVVSLVVGVLYTPFVLSYSFVIYRGLRKIKGEVSFDPGRRRRIWVMLVGILGLMVVGSMIAVAVLYFIRGAGDKAKDSRIISDMNQLRTLAATEYEGDYGFLVEDGGIDNPNLSLLRRDIEDQGGDLVIRAGETGYCAYTPLNDGNYYCIDTDSSSRVYADPSFTCRSPEFFCPILFKN